MLQQLVCFTVEQAKTEKVDDSEEEGTRHFMVNIIEPQFNLHSEDANVSYDIFASYKLIHSL